MGREVRRVALDFDWPINEKWQGFLNPHYTAKQCDSCGGSGYSRVANRYLDEWYGNAPFDPRYTASVPFEPTHPVITAMARRNVDGAPEFYRRTHGAFSTETVVAEEARRLADHFNSGWSHHLSQDDVDALVAAERLWDFTRTPRNDAQREIVRQKIADGENSWLPESNGYRPTAQEVNEWSLSGFGHDSINSGVCVEARCKRNGEPHTCAACDGHGEIWPSAEAKALYDAWEPEEPPAGDGWQMWETVSEGSPISPVFSTPEDLARYLAKHPWGVDRGTTYEQWLGMIKVGWAPSAVSSPAHGLETGVQAVAREAQ